MPKATAQPLLLASAFFDAQPTVQASAEVAPPTDTDLAGYAMRSTPAGAPSPGHQPMGVEALPRVTDAERIRANTLATTIALSEGELTDAAKHALRAWSGQGGLGGSTNAFYTPRALVRFIWDLVTELQPAPRALEFSCGGGAFFETPRALVRFIWDLVTELQPAPRALEFSCGGGAFFESAPAFTELTGVEIDETTARVAQALYPHATVHHAPFEQYARQSEDALFPLVIGNPPFGARGETARLHRPHLQDVHWYFVLEGLTRVQPGGLMAVVVPESMLRNKSDRFLREQLLDAAHVLTASLIPTSAFDDTGAGVTTVLLVLRRHDAGVSEILRGLTAEERAQVHQQRQSSASTLLIEGRAQFYKTPGDAWATQGTFTALSDKATVTSGRFGEPQLHGPLTVDAEKLERLIAECRGAWNGLLTRPLLEALIETVLGQDAAITAHAIKAQPHPIREGQLSDCNRYRFQNGHWAYDTALNDPAVRSALEVAQAVTAARLGTGRDAQRLTARSRAGQLHAQHLATYGTYPLATLKAASALLPVLNVLVTSGGDVPRLLADLPPVQLQLAHGTVAEIAQQLEAYGLLDEDALMLHALVSRSVAGAHLLAEYAYTGTTWEANSTYYTGLAHRKASIADHLAAGESGLHLQALQNQAQRLRQAAPWRELSEMTLEARDQLIPLTALTDWINDCLGTVAQVKRNRWDTAGEEVGLVLAQRSDHRVSLRLRQTTEEKDNLAVRRNVDAARIRELEAYLNYQTPVDPVTGQDTKTEAQINAERNAHQQKAMRLEADLAAHFWSWALRSEHAQRIEQALNEGRYGLLERTQDSRPLILPAYQGPLAHPFQAAHVRSAARMDGVILNFDVGLGKTLTGLMLAALLKQSGRARLPAIVVPLSRLGDWVMNAATALPGMKLLVIGGDVQHGPDGTVLLDDDGEPVVKEDTGARRRQKRATLLSDPPELLLMSFEAFEDIAMLDTTRKAYVESESTLMSGAATAATFDERSRKLAGHREIVAHERYLQRHLARVKVSSGTDIPFEATGIDSLIVDEGHQLKNVFAPGRTYGESSPKFMGAGGESNRALDALHKARFVRERGGCVTLLTASWFTNGPLEIFNMLSLVTDALPEYGISDVEAFTARFLQLEPRLITGPDGEVEYRMAVVGFRNLDELRSIISQHVIRETEDTCLMHQGVGMPLPPRVDVEHVFDLSEDVQAAYDAEQACVQGAEREGEQHLFSIFARMQKLTLHPPLLNVDAPNARFAECVQACLSARASGGRNLIFMSLGGEKGETYRVLKGMLVAAGYPAGEIEVITGSSHPTAGDRLKVERRLRRGELSCVIGSVVIEQGANYQGVSDVHHLDYPHHFEAYRQRIGRARRQGTTVREIRNHLYFARGSFDVLRYQGMLGKKGWADQVHDPSVQGASGSLGFDGEEIAVMLSRDPQTTRALIAAKKEARAAESRSASLMNDLALIREYLDTVSLLAQRDRAARSRKEGPSRPDLAGIERLISRLRGLHASFEALRAAGHPLTAISRLKSPPVWVSGLPLHPGLSFTLAGAAKVVAVATNGSATLIVTDAQTNRDALPVTALDAARDVLPTRDDDAYGPEAFQALSASLRQRVLQAEAVQPLEVTALPERGELLAPPAAFPVRPAPLRYGLSVIPALRAVPDAAVYSIQGDTLRLGERPGATLVIVECRAGGEVRKVTLVIPDPARLARTKALMQCGAPEVRFRMDALLRTAV